MEDKIQEAFNTIGVIQNNADMRARLRAIAKIARASQEDHHLFEVIAEIAEGADEYDE